MPDSPKWYFTADTNAQGNTYIKAYQTAWDKVAKKSKRTTSRHVGRLLPDDRVAISPKFLLDHPEYKGQDWYWGANKKLVPLSEYLDDFPDHPGSQPLPEDDEQQDCLSVGLTWTALHIAQSSGILAHLQEVFGKTLGEQLLYLAIYKLAGGTSMASYDIWRQQVWLPSHYRMSSQKISEILQQVRQAQVHEYFGYRHRRQGEIWEKIFAANPELKGKKIEYALDSTSISTYADSDLAEYGHAKRDLHLKQINFTVVCDQASGEIVFSYLYDGSINDLASFQDVLWAMKEAGFDMDNNVFVSDRGYHSVINVQKLLQSNVSFVLGVPRKEDAIKQAFKRHHNQLVNGGFYNGYLKASAFTYEEKWTAGSTPAKVYVHLYRLDGCYEEKRNEIWTNAAKIVEAKSKGERVPNEQWEKYGRFVLEGKSQQGKPTWMINTTLMDQVSEIATQFILRSDCIGHPFEALQAYRQRQIVEEDFKQLKNWLDGDRLRVGPQAREGKIFVITLATTLRMMMHHAAMKTIEEKPGTRVPFDSIDTLIKSLDLIKANKRKNANAWVRKTITAKCRRYLELLRIPEPPRTLKICIR